MAMETFRCAPVEKLNLAGKMGYSGKGCQNDLGRPEVQ